MEIFEKEAAHKPDELFKKIRKNLTELFTWNKSFSLMNAFVSIRCSSLSVDVRIGPLLHIRANIVILLMSSIALRLHWYRARCFILTRFYAALAWDEIRMDIAISIARLRTLLITFGLFGCLEHRHWRMQTTLKVNSFSIERIQFWSSRADSNIDHRKNVVCETGFWLEFEVKCASKHVCRLTIHDSEAKEKDSSCPFGEWFS